MLRVTRAGGILDKTIWCAGILAAGWAGGCGSEREPITAESSQYEVADDNEPSAPPTAPSDAPAPFSPPAQSPAPAAGSPTPQPDAVPVPKPPAVSSAALNTYEVPEGSPEELLGELDKLNRTLIIMGAPQDVQSATFKIWISEAGPVMKAKRDLAEKLLSTDGLTPEIRTQAIRAKLESLNRMAVAGMDAAIEPAAQYAQELAEGADEQMAALAKLALLTKQIEDWAESQEGPSPVGQLPALLTESPAAEPQVLNLFLVGLLLYQRNLREPASDVFKALGDTFEGEREKQLADRVAGFVGQARMLDVQMRMFAVLEKEPNAMPALLASAQKLADNSPPQSAISLLWQIATQLEYSGDMEGAGQLFDVIRTKYADSEDEQIAEVAKQRLETFDKHAALLGTPLTIEGVTGDGTPLDWSQYKGKVVLVDFWATWCGPCLQELPNLEANYEQYHSQGFEIIGVNLDDDREAAKQFMQRRGLPWTTVFAVEAVGDGFANPNAVKCGVDAIPFILLIGRDGNVVALHVRGAQLGERLAQMLAAP